MRFTPAAIHEAGHAIAAFAVGWRLAGGGMWARDEVGQTHLDGDDFYRHHRKGLLVGLAGYAAEFRYFGSSARLSDDPHFRSHVRAARKRRMEPSHDTKDAAERIFTMSRYDLPTAQVRDIFRHHEDVAARFVRNPAVWGSIWAAANWLQYRGRLSPSEFSLFLDPVLLDGLRIAWALEARRSLAVPLAL